MTPGIRLGQNETAAKRSGHAREYRDKTHVEGTGRSSSWQWHSLEGKAIDLRKINLFERRSETQKEPAISSGGGA